MKRLLIFCLYILGIWPARVLSQLRITEQSKILTSRIRFENESLIEFARINHFDYVLFGWHSPNWPEVKTDFQALIKQNNKWYLYKSRFWIRSKPSKQRNDTLMQISKKLSQREKRTIIKSLGIRKAFSITNEEIKSFENCSCIKRVVRNDGSVIIYDNQPTDSGTDMLIEIKDGRFKQIGFQLADFKLENCLCNQPALRIYDFVKTFKGLRRATQNILPAFND